MKSYYKNNLHKVRARQLVHKALRKGKLIKPLNCNNCLLIKKLEAHHPDYSKPLKVMWLCKLCHNRIEFMK